MKRFDFACWGIFFNTGSQSDVLLKCLNVTYKPRPFLTPHTNSTLFQINKLQLHLFSTEYQMELVDSMEEDMPPRAGLL